MRKLLRMRKLAIMMHCHAVPRPVTLTEKIGMLLT